MIGIGCLAPVILAVLGAVIGNALAGPTGAADHQDCNQAL